ncbi:GM24749 [Drosophila sechellia]|uniref:GM24749 n=1 Tax=Drosophila sechellia TaxID=7238 RepID=B4HEE5_DROSE|nr:GM24749 [Drosophila sechellia]
MPNAIQPSSHRHRHRLRRMDHLHHQDDDDGGSGGGGGSGSMVLLLMNKMGAMAPQKSYPSCPAFSSSYPTCAGHVNDIFFQANEGGF